MRLPSRITITLTGKVSQIHGAIDDERRRELREAVTAIKGVRGCTVTSVVKGDTQTVTLELPFVTQRGMQGLDQILRGYGSMERFFASYAYPVVTDARPII